MLDYLSIVNLLIEYIEENLQSDLSMEALSKKINYSPYYIQRIFSAATHIPIHDYITERRLIKAGEEILNGSTIVDAALKYGYSSHNGFTKAFEKKFGLPPSRVDECTGIVMDRPLRIMERDLYNKKGNICICHEVICLEKLMLEGSILTVDLKDFWNDERLKHSVEEKVISYIKANKVNPTYCIGIPCNSGSEVQYFIGRRAEEGAHDSHECSAEHRLILPKSDYIKFSYRGNFKENPHIVIGDALKCFSTCRIKPNQESIDHIEIFTKDYPETEIFDILVPIKESRIV